MDHKTVRKEMDKCYRNVDLEENEQDICVEKKTNEIVLQ